PRQFSICNNLGTLPFGSRQVALPQFGAHASVGALVGAAPLTGGSSRSRPASSRHCSARAKQDRAQGPLRSPVRFFHTDADFNSGASLTEAAGASGSLPASALLPATSCLGAFQPPVAVARGGTVVAGPSR